MNRGLAYFMVEKLKEARSDLETALSLNPENEIAKLALTELEKVGC